MAYLWLKALHVISVMAWFAGLVYIFRLYVYHVENQGKKDVTDVLEVMERRLYRAICTPAAIASLIFGVGMISMQTSLLKAGWFHAKLTAVVFLFAYHGYSGKVRRDFANGTINLTSKQCRMLNELPTVLMIVIVIMVIVKPF